jgi:hypothetical protein
VLDGRGSVPGRTYSLSSILALGLTQPLMKCVPGAISVEVKLRVHEADHSAPSSAEIKNGGAILPLPHTSSWSVA